MKFLRQSTASQEIFLGYFVDSVDGNTEETGLTIANTDIRLGKNGATTLANKNSGGATHISNGIYSAVLDATDTNTAGLLEVFSHPTGAQAFKDSYTVLPTAVYDWMLAGGTLPGQSSALAIRSGTAQAGTSNTITLDAGASAVTDAYRGSNIRTSVSTPRYITAYNGTTKVATVDRNFDASPTGSTTFDVVEFGPDVATTVQIANGVLDDALSSHVVAGSVGERIGRIPNAAAGANGGLPTVDANARVSSNVTAMAANVINASALAADAVTEIQTGLATASALTAAASDVTAVKAKTDQLTFTQANHVDANVQRINDVTVNGTGSGGTPWGP